MKATHKLAEDRYEVLRSKAREIANSSLPVAMINGRGQSINLRESVKLHGMDYISKSKVREWKDSPLRKVDWDWHGGVAEYSWRHPKRFELAIWYRDLFLCGAALGRPTWHGGKLRLDFIEASPKTTPLTR